MPLTKCYCVRCGLAAVGSIGGVEKASPIVDGALSVVVGGQWPPSSSSIASGAAYQRLPKSFEEVFDALGRSAEPAINAASHDPLHQVIEERVDLGSAIPPDRPVRFGSA